VATKRKGRHPAAFRQMAVGRMKHCENIVALSEELGISRRLLYRWRHQLDPIDGGHEPPPESPRESTLRKENHQLAKGSALDIPNPGAVSECPRKRPWS
jgi:transposase-like protein